LARPNEPHYPSAFTQEVGLAVLGRSNLHHDVRCCPQFGRIGDDRSSSFLIFSVRGVDLVTRTGLDSDIKAKFPEF
jgi:hypothetical protein